MRPLRANCTLLQTHEKFCGFRVTLRGGVCKEDRVPSATGQAAGGNRSPSKCDTSCHHLRPVRLTLAGFSHCGVRGLPCRGYCRQAQHTARACCFGMLSNFLGQRHSRAGTLAPVARMREHGAAVKHAQPSSAVNSRYSHHPLCGCKTIEFTRRTDSPVGRAREGSTVREASAPGPGLCSVRPSWPGFFAAPRAHRETARPLQRRSTSSAQTSEDPPFASLTSLTWPDRLQLILRQEPHDIAMEFRSRNWTVVNTNRASALRWRCQADPPGLVSAMLLQRP